MEKFMEDISSNAMSPSDGDFGFRVATIEEVERACQIIESLPDVPNSVAQLMKNLAPKQLSMAANFTRMGASLDVKSTMMPFVVHDFSRLWENMWVDKMDGTGGKTARYSPLYLIVLAGTYRLPEAFLIGTDMTIIGLSDDYPTLLLEGWEKSDLPEMKPPAWYYFDKTGFRFANVRLDVPPDTSVLSPQLNLDLNTR
jgi:hypothetical protein